MKKNTWKRVKSAVLATALSLAMIVPTCLSMNAGVSGVSVSESVAPQTSAEPQTSSEPSGETYIKGDVNGDGMIGLDDAQMIEKFALKLIRINDDLQRKVADVDADGTIKLVDVQLCLEMITGIVSGYEETAIKKIDTMPALSAKAEVVDNQLCYTIAAENADIQMLDYAVVYDTDVLCPVQKDDEFVSYEITGGKVSVSGILDKGNAVVLAAVYKESKLHTGDVATVTFELREGKSLSDAKPIKLIPNSAVYKGDFSNAPADEVVKTDISSLVLTAPQASAEPKTSANPAQAGYEPSVEAVKTQDGNIRVAVKMNRNIGYFFDIGLMYNPTEVRYVDSEWGEEFIRKNAMDGYFAKSNIEMKDYVVAGGTTWQEKFDYSGEVVFYVTFEPLEDVTETQFSVCSNSAQYANLLPEGGTLSDIAPAEHSCTIDLTAPAPVEPAPTPSRMEETIQNEDGSVTNKVTETQTREDGSYVERVAETTTGGSGDVSEKVTETVTNPDGTTTTTIRETITKTDGTTEELDKVTSQDEAGRLISLLNKLIKMAEDIYNRLSVLEKELADGFSFTKTRTETGSLGENGQTVSGCSVVDEVKDASGTSVEKYEYDGNALPENVEWNTSRMDNPDAADKGTMESEHVTEYDVYDISPVSDGKVTDVSEGSVKVTLHCGNRWAGKKVRVYDFKNNRWLDAVAEGEYVSFHAEHFSRYAIAEAAVTLGDIDGDNEITLKDAQLALKAALKLAPLEGDKADAADVDGDKAVTLQDAQKILKRALKLITTF